MKGPLRIPLSFLLCPVDVPQNLHCGLDGPYLTLPQVRELDRDCGAAPGRVVRTQWHEVFGLS
jgi:hypothetical protein